MLQQRPFLWNFFVASSAIPVSADNTTVWETKAQTGGDGKVEDDFADDEDQVESDDTSVIADSNGKEDEDA